MQQLRCSLRGGICHGPVLPLRRRASTSPPGEIRTGVQDTFLRKKQLEDTGTDHTTCVCSVGWCRTSCSLFWGNLKTKTAEPLKFLVSDAAEPFFAAAFGWENVSPLLAGSMPVLSTWPHSH